MYETLNVSTLEISDTPLIVSKLSSDQKNDFFHQISKSSKIVQKWRENIAEKPKTLYFQKVIELGSYDK